MSESTFVSIGGRRLEYRYFNPPTPSNAPTLVMLHEGLGSVPMWKQFPGQLADATGARVLAYSRFGHGRSDASPRPYGTLEMQESEALDVLPALLHALDVKRPILFGHSDGASIALIYAGGAAREVSGLILLAPHVFVEDICVTSVERTRQRFLETDLRQKLAPYHDDPECVFWMWNNAWLDPSFRNWNIERYLPSITCPTLAIQGYEDEYGTMEQLDRLARAIPRVQLLKLENCRHSPHRDRPEVVLAETQLFIARL